MKFNGFGAGFSTVGDSDTGFGNFEMLRKQFDKRRIGCAVVRLRMKINCKFAWGGFDDLFLGAAWFYGNSILMHMAIITSGVV